MSMKIKTNATVQTIDLWTGEILKVSKAHNLVVNDGLNRVADLIGGISSTPYEYIGIGTNNTAVVATDTDLNSEVKRSTIITPTDEGTGIVRYDYTFTFGTGESYIIRELGLFDSATLSGGTIFNRLIIDDHSVDDSNGLIISLTITVSNT